MLHGFSAFVGGGALGVFLSDHVKLTRVEGPSMLPLLTPQDRVLGLSPALFATLFRVQDTLLWWRRRDGVASRLLRCWHDRVVVCELSPGMHYCKVTRVESDDGDADGPIDSLTLRGINAKESRDSREFGAVPLGSVKSVVLCKVWPSFDPYLGRAFTVDEP